MYATGHCVGRDLPTAYRWFARALHQEPQNSRISADLQVLWRVIIPLAKPAIVAVALFNFIYAWNDFYGPLVYLASNQDAQTLSVALSSFRSLHHVDWNLTMAAALIFMLPVIVIFFFAQRVFIEGITLTGVKG